MEQLLRAERRKYHREIDSLRTKLFITRLYAICMTLFCIVMGIMFMQSHNTLKAENLDLTTNFLASMEEKDNEIKAIQSNYSYLEERLDSFVNTINELTSISETLDQQNKSLVESNQQYHEELAEFKQREELYNKYEYALYDGKKRTDITYDQLLTLEDLLEESTVNDEDLILSIVMTESKGVEKARNSSSTAKGYGQFLDGTSKFVYTRLMDKPVSSWNPNIALNGEMNLEMMVHYIDYLYEVNNGNLYEIIRDYRGKQDISGYVAKIDSYLLNVDKSVEQISLELAQR